VGEAGERLVRSLEAPGRKASTLAAYALDPHNAERLWEVSLQMLGDAVIRLEARQTEN
jgi:hypothetical protein